MTKQLISLMTSFQSLRGILCKIVFDNKIIQIFTMNLRVRGVYVSILKVPAFIIQFAGRQKILTIFTSSGVVIASHKSNANYIFSWGMFCHSICLAPQPAIPFADSPCDGNVSHRVGGGGNIYKRPNLISFADRFSTFSIIRFITYVMPICIIQSIYSLFCRSSAHARVSLQGSSPLYTQTCSHFP